MPLLKPSDVTLLELRDAVLCVECELISYNNTGNCLACGSSAVMNLSRVLGGSLRGQETASMVSDETIGKAVHETLDWIPMAEPKVAAMAAARKREEPARAVGDLSRPSGSGTSGSGAAGLARLNPVPAMQFVVERASTLTRANGSALAMWQGNRMVCQASAGEAVPMIGSEVQASGLSGLCLRTGQVWRCDDAYTDRNVNVEACRDLGIRSVIAAPLNHLNKVLGILQVLSSEAFAFDDRDVATVQLLSHLMVMAFARKAERRSMAIERGMKLALAGGH